MQSVGDLLAAKGSLAWSIGPQATVYEALQLMSDKDVGAIVVLKDDKVVGLFTERDYARKLVLKGKFSRDTAVNELMTRNVLYVEAHNTVEECMVLMTNHRVRHLPVLDNGRLAGIVSIGDTVKHIISQQQFTIEQLEKYIAGSY